MSDSAFKDFVQNQTSGEWTQTTNFIVGVFSDRETFETALRVLQNRGYSMEEISLLMNDRARSQYFSDDADETGALGKIAAADLRGDQSFVLPGINLKVVGSLAATFANSGAGGLTGGIANALVGAGISEQTAARCEQSVKNGGIVVAVSLRSADDADYFAAEFRHQQFDATYETHEKPISSVSKQENYANSIKFENQMSQKYEPKPYFPRITIDTANIEYETDWNQSQTQSASPPDTLTAAEPVAPQAEAAPRYKQIAAWIAEREKQPTKPLIKNETYTLNFAVGSQAFESNLIDSGESKIAQSDIPDGGLDTDWIVTAKNVKLAALDADVLIDRIEPSDADNGETSDSAAWSAAFSLHIPQLADSRTVNLKITALAVKDAELHVLILAKKRIYRQFIVELNVQANKPRAVRAKPAYEKTTAKITEKTAATITGEMIHARAGELDFRTAHEWLTPGGTLTVAVVNDGAKAFVTGEIGGSEITSLPNWYANEKSVAPAIANLRLAAKNFCDDADAYLNDINPNDLLTRIKDATFPNQFVFHDNADDAHRQIWDDKIAQSEKLRRLAFYGFQLYEAIFPRETDLRKWLDQLQMGWRINLSWSEISKAGYIANIPWGLIYVEPPPAAGQPVDAFKFFGLRYRLEYTAYDIRAPRSKALGHQSQTFTANCFYWGKQPNDAAAVEAVWQKTQLEQRANQIFISGDSGEANPKEALVKMLDTPAPNPMPVLYLFCHCEVGDGSRPVLRFGSGKQSADLIEQIDFGTTAFADQPLVFINACTSAAGSADVANQLVETFFRRDCRAFLGTEIYMPIQLASRFAFVFNQFFCREIDPAPIAAGEAVYQSRLFLWHQYRNLGGIFYSYINEYDLFMADEAELKGLAR